MQATSLSINLPGPCDAKCPFCISKLTGGNEHNTQRLLNNLDKALKYAAYHNVDTVLITGKGEPTLQEIVYKIIKDAQRKMFPIIELQTNGYKLWKERNHGILEQLAAYGLTTIAISVSSPDYIKNAAIVGLTLDYNYYDLIAKINEIGLLCRVSLNLIEEEMDVEKLRCFAECLKSAGAHQLTLRELGVPKNPTDNVTIHNIIQWITENKLSQNTLAALGHEISDQERMLRTVPYGPAVYDYKGLATILTTCMTDNINPEEIRSLILQPNGHLYHSWNYEGSILL